MISQTVEVTGSEPGYLVVKPLQQGCDSCSTGACGVTNIARLLGSQSHHLRIVDDGKYNVGDTAELLLDETIFVRSVIVQYLLPLFAMILMVFVASALSQLLVFQLIAAILGLAGGVFVSRYLIRWYEYRLDTRHLRLRPLS